MIDMHNHILPNVDDGSRSLEESIKLLEALHKASFHTFILTPHYGSKRKITPTKALIIKQFDLLKAEVQKRALPVKLFLGSEFDAHSKLHQELNHGFTLAGSNTLLVDFSFKEDDMEEIIYNLTTLGYNVIVAHAERYERVSLERLRALRSSKVLLQVNIISLIKGGPKRRYNKAKKLLKENLVDVLGTDIHRYHKDLADTLSKTMKKIQSWVTPETFKNMTHKTIQTKVLSDETH